MDQAIPLKAGASSPAHLEIPWMKRWEKKAESERAAIEDDLTTRLIKIDYMAMLEELEFK